MIIAFETPKNSKVNTLINKIVGSTAHCFIDDYTENEDRLAYCDCHSFDHLEYSGYGELGSKSYGYRFVFRGSENDTEAEEAMAENGCEYYPEAVNRDNVEDFNNAYIMAYHLSSYIEIKGQLPKNSTAYKTLHIYDGGGFVFQETLEEAKRQYDEHKEKLLQYGYEF